MASEIVEKTMLHDACEQSRVALQLVQRIDAASRTLTDEQRQKVAELVGMLEGLSDSLLDEIS